MAAAAVEHDDVVDLEEQESPKYNRPNKRLSFEVDDRITVQLDVDLCRALARHLKEFPAENPAIFALGISLSRIK